VNFVNRVVLLGIFSLVMVSGVTAAQGSDSYFADNHLEPTFHPLPDNVEVLLLENGMEVILMPNPAQPMVGMFTQVRVGSAWEDFRTSGMSHMLEHLLFNGSDKYTQEEQYAMADRAGAYNNANTTDFFTNFMMVIPAGAMETGMELQSEMLFHSNLPEEKFAKEKGIVLGELVQNRDRSGHDTAVAMRQAMYGGTSLELPTLGTRSTIANMDREEVYDFYKKWYVPNNMILTLAGNFDRDKAVELLDEYYGQVTPGSLELSGLQVVSDISQTSSITRRLGSERVLALSFDAPSYGMNDFFPYLVMTDMLNLEGSGILTKTLQEMDPDQRPEVSSWWEKTPGFSRLNFEFSLTEDMNPEDMYRIIQESVRNALETGISEDEITGIIRMAETYTLLEREQLRMTGIYIAEPVAVGGSDFFINYLPNLRGVNAEQVVRALNNWLIDAPCQAVLIEPAEAGDSESGGMSGMPPGMKMPSGMAAAMKKQSMATEEEDVDSEEADEQATPAPLQVDRSVLRNGSTLVSQTNPDSPLMAIHLAVRGRAMIDQENGSAGALDLVHRLLSEGYSGCDHACLAKRLRQMGAVVKLVDDARIPMDNYYTTGYFSFIRIETAAQFGAQALELLVEEIQHAAFNEQAFEEVRKDRIASLERGSQSARKIANRMLEDALYMDNPLVLPPEGSVESLSELDYDQMRVVYRKAFSPENLVFSIVGPSSHDDLKTRIEDMLPGHGKSAPVLPALPITEAPAHLTASIGGEVCAVRLGSIQVVDKADSAALRLVTAIMSNRMAMDLRETRGLSYSVGASMSVSRGLGEFNAWLNPPSERKDEGHQALVDFINAFDAADITQDELDEIRSARQGRMMMRRLSSMGQAYYMAMAELDGDLSSYLSALTTYDNVTLADMQMAAEKYLKNLNLVEVVVD